MSKRKYLSALIVCVLSICSVFCTNAFAIQNTYTLSKLNMTLSISDDLLVIEQTSSPQDEVFSKLKLDYEGTMNTLKADNVYLYAQPMDGSYKITISMIENDESQSYFNFATISESQVDDIKNAFLHQENCTGCTTYKSSDERVLYFCPTSKYQNEDNTQYSVAQYITIVNGQRIIIQLVSTKGAYTDEMIKQLRDIVDSIEFTKIEDKSFDMSSYSLYMYIGISVLCLVVIIVSITKIIKNSKKKKQDSIDYDDFIINDIDELYDDQNKTKSSENNPSSLTNTVQDDNSPTEINGNEEDYEKEEDEPLVIVYDVNEFLNNKDVDKSDSTKQPEQTEQEEQEEQTEHTNYETESVHKEKAEDESTKDTIEQNCSSDIQTEEKNLNTDTKSVSANKPESITKKDRENTVDDDFITYEASEVGINKPISRTNISRFDIINNVREEEFDILKDNSENTREDSIEINEFEIPNSYSDTVRKHHNKNEENKEYKKRRSIEPTDKPAGVVVKILKKLLNGLLGIVFLIAYLISLLFKKNNNKKRK